MVVVTVYHVSMRAKYPHQKDREKLVHVDPFCGNQLLHDVAVQTRTGKPLSQSRRISRMCLSMQVKHRHAHVERSWLKSLPCDLLWIVLCL